MIKTFLEVTHARRRGLAIAFLVGVILGVPLTKTLTLDYNAEMMVTPARYSSDTKPSGEGGMSSLASTAALLTGGGGGEGALSDFALYLQLLTSPRVTQALFKNDPGIVHELYRDQWRGDHWGPPRNAIAELKQTIFGLLGQPEWAPPDALSLSDMLTAKIKIDKTERASVATISYLTPNRMFGINLLNALHHETEQIMRDDAKASSAAKAEYLTQLISNTPGVGVNDVIIQAEMRNQIAAAISNTPVPFAAEFIATPDAPLLPNRKIFILFPLLCGVLAVLGTFGYFMFRQWRGLNYPLPASFAWMRD